MTASESAKAGGGSIAERLRIESEIDEEIAFHVASRAQDLEQSGLGAAEAQRLAITRFGNLARILFNATEGRSCCRDYT